MESTPAFSTETLMGELGSWNKQEDTFRQLFGDQALRNRDFQQMKLREYDRLWRRYQGKAMTTDEKSLLVMLRYQRRRMEKALHPGLLRRMLHRLAGTLKALIENRLERTRSRQVAPFPYEQIPVPQRQEPQGQGPSHSRHINLNQEQAQRRRYGQNLGRRLRRDRGKSKGPSL